MSDRAPASGHRPSIAQRFAFATVVTVLTAAAGVVALELWLRHEWGRPLADGSDPYAAFAYVARHHRLPPNASIRVLKSPLSGRDVRIETNSLGLRDDELPAARRPGERRVLVLGDSITGGAYLPREEGYVERAEAALREALPGAPVEVVNAGISDIGFRQELEILKNPGLSLAPDVVVVGFYLNDSRPPWGFAAELGHPGWLRRNFLVADRAFQHARMRRWLADTGEDRFAWVAAVPRLPWARDPAALRELARMARFDWGSAWEPASFAALDPDLTELRRLSAEHHFRVLILILPVRFQVRAEFLDRTPQQAMESRARALGFASLDVLPDLRAHRGDALFFDQCHLTPQGNRIVGQRLAESLLAMLAPPSP